MRLRIHDPGWLLNSIHDHRMHLELTIVVQVSNDHRCGLSDCVLNDRPIQRSYRKFDTSGKLVFCDKQGWSY